MKNSKFRFWLIATILCLAMIFLQSALPAETSKAESGGLLKMLQEFWPSLTHNTLRKAAHFTEYAFLGLCALGMFYRAKNFKLAKPLLFTLYTALTDETLQLFVEGRSGQITDIWLDFFGAVVGIIFLWLIFKIRRK